ncbi:MAG: DUF3662 and FHA domain-containing protein [Coriobacteriia bacterium]|nr:DUF3662 and FHA domain-containing protein [Coriobacteriia bacterium]
MGLFSRFEHKVEDGFDGMNEKLFDAPISPVQIAKKAEKQMRREKMVGAGKEFAPTLYTVLVNPDDDERLFGYYPTLAGETETYLRSAAQKAGLVMDGTPLVRFIVDDDLRHGKFDIIAEMVSAPIIAQLRQEEMERYGLAGAQQPAAPAPAPAPAHPAPEGGYRSSGIDVMSEDAELYGAGPAAVPTPVPAPAPAGASVAEPIMPQTTAFAGGQAAGQSTGTPRLVNLNTNRSFKLTNPTTVLGRAITSDIVLDDLNVSRTHAEVLRETSVLWKVADLGSTNGTLVNGKHIASAVLAEGDRITLGTTTFLFTYN